MNSEAYDEILDICEELSYREKFRLAQHLIQIARKEEEDAHPDRKESRSHDPETIRYVAERLLKSKPTKKSTLLNSIGAMFQFQGGISEVDKELIVYELQKRRYLSIDQDGRVSYKTSFFD